LSKYLKGTKKGKREQEKTEKKERKNDGKKRQVRREKAVTHYVSI